jgi:hypothetical protein
MARSRLPTYHANVAVTAPVEVSREYSVDFGDNDQRTLTLQDIVTAYNAGEITADTFLWAEGMGDWKALGEVPDVVDALHAAASAPEASPSPVSAASSPRSSAGGGAVASPWDPRPAEPKPQPQQTDAALARAASRKGAGQRAAPTADLFGSFDPRSDEAVATSVREPDLGAAGARNESSVLFSLSALTQSAPKPSGPAPMTATAHKPAATTNSGNNREDSGLIDLRALTAAAPAQAQPAAEPLMNSPLGVSPLGMSPLGLAAPFGGGVESHVGPLGPPAKSSKTGLFVGAGIVIAALVIAFAFIMRPSDPPPAPPAPAPEQAQAPVTGTPTAEETAAVTAKPPATGVAEETAAPDAGSAQAKTPRAPSRPRTPRKGGEETKSGGSQAATEKKPVKRSPCGCAPGDLQCAMRCAAGK